MSRLLKSLNNAQRERQQDVEMAPDADSPEMDSGDGEPGYFWTSLILLALVCGLIVGGYLLLRDLMPGLLQ
jgi:hypothetical protein